MSQIIETLSLLRTVNPICNQIANDLQMIEESFRNGEIAAMERNHLITEIRDVRVAMECAGNEIAMRYTVQACNVLLSVV